MQILAIERELPSGPATTMDPLLRVEAACVWDLKKRGIIRDIWFTAAGNHAVIMLECASATEARQHLAMLPLVHAGVIDFTIHELRNYDGIERLFAHRLGSPGDAAKQHHANGHRGSESTCAPTGRRASVAGPRDPGSRKRSHRTPPSIKA